MTAQLVGSTQVPLRRFQVTTLERVSPASLSAVASGDTSSNSRSCRMLRGYVNDAVG
jgi:hypothetical protein